MTKVKVGYKRGCVGQVNELLVSLVAAKTIKEKIAAAGVGSSFLVQNVPNPLFQVTWQFSFTILFPRFLSQSWKYMHGYYDVCHNFSFRASSSYCEACTQQYSNAVLSQQIKSVRCMYSLACGG